tara:strand:- start:108 stop:260 length:153 start_codon:yes stop_codon:yes gene_type:complete
MIVRITIAKAAPPLKAADQEAEEGQEEEPLESKKVIGSMDVSTWTTKTWQ